jgi:hypothetical protein
MPAPETETKPGSGRRLGLPLLICVASLVGLLAIGATVYFLFFTGDKKLLVQRKPLVNKPQLQTPSADSTKTLPPTNGETEDVDAGETTSELESNEPIPTALRSVPKLKRPTWQMPESLNPLVEPLNHQWQPGRELGYQFDITGEEDGVVNRYSGSLLLQPTSLASVVPRSDRPRKFHPAVEYGSALALGDGTLITGLELVEGDPVVELVIDGQVYDAQVQKRLPELRVAVLEIPGMMFSPLPYDRFTILEGHSILVWRTPNGDLALEDVTLRSKKTGKVSPHTVGAAIVKGWGGISGIVTNNTDRTSTEFDGVFTPLSKVAKSPFWKKSGVFNDAFDRKLLSRMELSSALEKQVVQVVVHRKASGSDRPKVAFHSTLLNTNVPIKPFKPPVRGSKTKPHTAPYFHPVFTESYASVLRLDSRANLVEHPEDRDRDDVRSLPYFLGSPFVVPRVTLENGQNQSWTVESRIKFRTRAEEVKGRNAYKYSDFEFVYSDEEWEKTLAPNRARRTETYEVLGQSDGVAWIKRTLTLKSESDEVPEPGSRVSLGVPVSLTGEELMEFDIANGVLMGTEFNGQLVTQVGETKISYRFELMDSTTRLGVRPSWRSSQQAKYPLAYVDKPALMELLSATNNNDRGSALSLLMTIVPEPDSEIGEFLGANFDDFVSVRPARVINWIPPQCFPNLAKLHNESIPIQYLERSKAFPEAIEFVRENFADNEKVANVLMTRYPSEINSVVMGQLKKLKQFRSNDEMLLNLLEVGGTVEAIPALEELKKLIKSDRYNTHLDKKQIQRVDQVISVLEKRGGQQ